MSVDDDLIDFLYRTVTDIEKWQEVIKELCSITNCKKGIIALRKKSDANMVVPIYIKNEFESPLIYGFSEEEIGSYILHYKDDDPWTEIEYLNHPFEPYCISDYLSLDELKKCKIWEWLSPQGIDDSIVLDIRMYTDYWVSLNLFFDSSLPNVSKDAIAFLRSIQNRLRKVWELGSEYRLSKEFPTGANYFIDQKIYPSILISPDGHIIHTNKSAMEHMKVLEEKLLSIVHDNQLHFKDRAVSALVESTFEELKSMNYRPEDPLSKYIELDEWDCKCSFLGQPQDVVGREVGSRVLTFEPKDRKGLDNTVPIWESPVLTARESELVRILADGGRVVDFQNQFSLAKSTAHAHWGKVKEKLNVKDRSEIVLKSKFFVKNNN